MRTLRSFLAISCIAVLVAFATAISTAQEAGPKAPATAAAAPAPVLASVELTPATTDIFPGQKVKFTVVGKDAAGNVIKATPSTWFAAPFDLAAADESGTVSFFNPGEVLIGAIVGGRPHFTKVTVKAGPVTQVEITPVDTTLVVGATTKLVSVARSSEGNPRNDASFKWSSSMPEVAIVDAAGVVTALAPGKTQLSASSGSGMGSATVTVVKSNITGLSIEPRSTAARTIPIC